MIRWGVLGAGWIAEQAMLGAIAAADGAELVALASRDTRRARRFAKKYDIAATSKSYDDVVTSDDVDGVYVALANDAHLPWTIAALEAGKHVLCEKPLALSAADVDTMTAAAAASGRLLVEASWYRWHPRIRLVERLLRDIEALGRVRFVSAGFTFSGVADGNYRLDPAMGGGAMYDVGCYAVSAALWAFGSPPREVSAKADLGPTGVDLTMTATISFDDGDADIRASIVEEPRQWLVIAGERGEFELRGQAFTAWREDTELWFSGPAGAEPEPVAAADAYRSMVENVSAVAEGREGWVVPLAESRATAAVLDAAFESAATETAVAL